MRASIGAVLAIAASLASSAAHAVASEEIAIRWRDRRPEARGVLESIGPDGLRWTAPDGIVQSARWSAIREVDGLDETYRALLEDGVALWRASSRLVRGEVELAAPIFEGLADRWSGEDSRRHREALEGLVRCRIRLGDPVGAALAALERLELDIDSGAGGGLERLAGGWPAEAALWSVDPQGEDAARLRVGLRRFEESPVADEAAWLESVLVDAEPPDAASSEIRSGTPLAMRCALLRLVAETPPEALLARRDEWLDAAEPAEQRWIHARIAAVLAADPDRSLRRRGLVEWLCIPARFPDSVEAPLAFEAAARTASELGDEDLAWRLSEAAVRAAEELRTRPVPRTIP